MGKRIAVVVVSSVLLAACRPSSVPRNATPTPAPAVSPVAVAGTSGEAAFKHGSVDGPGTGGGTKDGQGDKLGAGGFKHGSVKGEGEGGGAKDSSGPKTAKQPGHGTGKGDGTGGGTRDGKGPDAGVLEKPAD